VNLRRGDRVSYSATKLCSRSGVLGGAFVVLIASPEAHAQRDTAATSGPSAGARGLCWRPRPAPRCRSFLVTEVGYEHPVITSRVGGFEPDPDFGGRFVGAIGVMVNRGPSVAWGGLLAGAAGDHPEDFSLRAEARYRKWIGPTRGIDLSAGVATKPVDTPLREPVRAHGLTAAVGVERGFVRAEARIDALYGGGRPRGAALVGVRFGSYAAPVAALALTVVGYAVAMGGMRD
jgi:hypothetical protein